MGAARRRPLRRRDDAVALRPGRQPVLGLPPRAERRGDVRDGRGPLAGGGGGGRGARGPGRPLRRRPVGARVYRAPRRLAARAADARRRRRRGRRAVRRGRARMAADRSSPVRRPGRGGLRTGGGRARLRSERCRSGRARSRARALLGSRTRGGSRRLRRLPGILRGGRLGERRALGAALRKPRATAGGHPRHRPLGGLRARRVDDVRRGVVAGAHQPAVRDRGARRSHQRPADGPGPRHARQAVRTQRLSHRGHRAGASHRLAGGRLLRLRRDLRSRAARLPRAAVRLVEHQRSVLAGSRRRAGGRPARPAAAVRLLLDHQHARAVHARAALPAPTGRASSPSTPTTARSSTKPGPISPTGPTWPRATSRRCATPTPPWAATCGCAPTATS